MSKKKRSRNPIKRYRQKQTDRSAPQGQQAPGHDIPADQLRSFSIDACRVIDDDERILEFSVSSEYRVQRYFGIEILSHRDGDIDYSRFDKGASVRDCHWGDQIAKVVGHSLKDGKLCVRAKFSKNTPRADIIYKDAKDGIRTNVSVRYERIGEGTLESDSTSENPVFRFKWLPVHVAFEPDPADPNVGVGRSNIQPQAQPTHQEEIKMNPELRRMLIELGMDPNSTEDQARAYMVRPEIQAKIAERAISTSTPAPAPAPAPAPVAAPAPAPTQAARGFTTSGQPPQGALDSRAAAEIVELGNRHGMQGEAVEALRNNTSLDEFRGKVLEKLGAKPAPVSASIGMDARDMQNYSLCRAITSAAQNGGKPTGFEGEVSQETARVMQANPEGFFLPLDIMQRDLQPEAGQRDLTVGTATAGGNLVATNLMASDFITMLREALVLGGLGIRTLTGLVGNIAIPRQTGGAQTYWVGEATAPTQGDASFDQVPMTPKTVGARTAFSRKLLMQSSIAVEQFVIADLAAAMAKALENGCLNGTGSSNQPTGLLNISGLNSLALDTNGRALAWADIVNFETEVTDDNVIGNMAYLTNARVRGALKTTEKFSGTNGNPIWDTGKAGAGELNGYSAAVSGLIPKTGTKGTGTNLSTMVFGKWSDFILALWGALDLQVNPFSEGDEGNVKVRALQDMDCNVRHPESFCKCTDIVTG